MSGEEYRTPDLEASLQDLYDVVAGIGVELEALVEIERARALHELGFDPLHNTGYDDEAAAEEEPTRHHGQEPEHDPEIPPWVNNRDDEGR